MKKIFSFLRILSFCFFVIFAVSQSYAVSIGEDEIIDVPPQCLNYNSTYATQPASGSSSWCEEGTYSDLSDTAYSWRWRCEGTFAGIPSGDAVTCSVPKNGCRVWYDYLIDGDNAPERYTPYTNTSTYKTWNWSLDKRNDDDHCDSSWCWLRASVQCRSVDYAIRVWYQYDMENRQSAVVYTPWSDVSTAFGAWAKLTESGQTECNNWCGIRMFVETRWDDALVNCSISYRHQADPTTSPWAADWDWSIMTYNTSDDEDCEDGRCGMQAQLSCVENTTSVCTANQVEDGSTRACPPGFSWQETSSRTCNSAGTAWWNYVWDDSGCVAQVCTANEIATESVACGSGYTGNQTRTNTCNSDGTAWNGWTEYNRDSCEEVICSANEVENESRSCPVWYTWDETRSRQCNSNGTSLSSWSWWNNSWCLANTCTANEVSTESVACGSGYTGDQTRTNTCNSSGTGYLWWTEYNRDNCVANECAPWEIEDETRACPTGFTGDETRDRTCDGSWSWWSWSWWNDSWCIANTCTANEVATESVACGSGYTGNQTRTNTCNWDGTAWLGWTEYNRDNCVENTPPTGTVSYAPAWPGWTTSDVVVTITCDDVGSGCDMIASFPASWTYVDDNTRSYTYSSNVTSSVVLRDNAGNSTFIPYNVDYIDQSTPWAPTITADDRSDDEWSDDNTTVLSTTVNNTGEISPRFNQYCMDGVNSCVPNDTTQPSTSNLSDGTYYYRARTCTQAGRCGPVSVFIIKIDTTAPTASDLSVVPGLSGPLLANDNQNFQVTASNGGGSDIVSIEGLFENYATENSYFTTPVVSTNNVLSFNGSTQLVDNNRSPQWYRNYQLYIYEICDEAGNCTREVDINGIETFEYQVYPNTTALWVADVTINELDDTTNIADWSLKEIVVTIEDVYGNEVIPASGISRNISFDFNTDNSLYLDQYARSWPSALYNSSNAWSIGNNLSRAFPNQSSSNWTYDFSFRAYTPTASFTHADPVGRFAIRGITADISWSIWSVSDVNITNSSIEARFAPLYSTVFGWELDNNGFIEWATQASNISVSKASSSVTPSSRNLLVQYWGQTDRLRLDISRSWNPTTPVSEANLSTVLENNFGNTNYPFNTLLTQEGWSIEDISETFLSSHISYTLNGLDVVYNGDVIGKSNYHDTNIDNNTSQSGIKVVWLTSSERTTELTNNQFDDDVTILGKLTKSTSRKDIQASVFSVIKNVDPTASNGSSPSINRLDTNSWSDNSDGTKLVNNSVLYFGELSWDDVELGNGSDEVVAWKKTIVVEGWNLYIRSNTTYANLGNDILGIVVLQDEDGNGWNLYIHPDVTNIVGTIYVDKSVISYNGTNELDGNTQASVLNNQLYIFGSLFSENTIGGSRSNPLECPYYVSVCSSTVEAQKYDLNYLRRYFVADSDNDWTKDSPSWNTIFTASDDYYEYPVVVEYNSRIQSTPPPLFD